MTAARLFRRVRARQAPLQPDFADFGTAFGLDMSMEPTPDEPQALRAESVARDIGWWRRIAARRNASRS